ncbi:Asp23/Gls24 family envelope stress response protein [Urechidicola croceus]|uniref:Uncharacterized protein n=1 Tax=Urechidicola croceus TaxID=1850246 RepID=A0A1D8PBF8_9FLAO|nr:DUF456 domain-containing protein [Urechidicola croceus]AOW21893.1 hypothetical protein LPB138_14895 [Urechidicola croceus]
MTHSFKHKMRSKTPGEITGWVLLIILGVVGLAILLGFVIMWLWNWLMPDLFGLTTITYWQAVGIFALSKILLGSFGGGCKNNDSKDADSSCNGSKKDFSKWKHYDKFWKEKGEQAFEEYTESKNTQNNN